jgi:flagellar basal-body rod modification protein FlgD
MIGEDGMTAISATAQSSGTTQPFRAKALGQADFIRLLTTQMQLQDPLDPVDNKEMIAQMAQFSSLAGIDQINQTLTAIAAQLDRLSAAQPPQSTLQE